jgi:hypothetical protein
LIASLLLDDYLGITVRPITSAVRRRDIYAPLPPADRHPHADELIAALLATADALNPRSEPRARA